MALAPRSLRSTATWPSALRLQAAPAWSTSTTACPPTTASLRLMFTARSSTPSLTPPPPLAITSAPRLRSSATSSSSVRPAARFPNDGTRPGLRLRRQSREHNLWQSPGYALHPRPERSSEPLSVCRQSVGTTDTNIVIGAPGSSGGQGEAYEFEGDTTQANFGDLLLAIPNPNPNAFPMPPSQFGAAVGGLGNDMIVGAPLGDVHHVNPHARSARSILLRRYNQRAGADADF